MIEAENAGQGKSPEFDFNLAENQFSETQTPRVTSYQGKIIGSLAGYRAYKYVEENKTADNDTWTGEPNSYSPIN